MSTNEITDSLKDLSLKNETDAPKKTTKPKATYDKAALKERWKILGTDPEQSKPSRQLHCADRETDIDML